MTPLLPFPLPPGPQAYPTGSGIRAPVGVMGWKGIAGTNKSGVAKVMKRGKDGGVKWCE